VSSQKQKDAGNLERQVERLREFARNQQLIVLDIIADVESGLNENRKGIIKLFKLVRERQMSHVLIEFRDRLTRFDYRYVADYLLLNGIEVTVKEEMDKKACQMEI
jgi:predicted site-specific integrase-resolvase